MEAGERMSLEQIQAFLKGSQNVRFEASQRSEIYEWVTRTLREQEYQQQGRAAKSVIRAYIGKVTGLSRAQVTRLLTRFSDTREVKEKPYRRNRFPNRY